MLAALSFSRPLGQTSATSLLPYYLIIGLIFPFVSSSIDEELEELAHTGDINNFLTRPISLYPWLLFKNFSEKISQFIYLAPLLLVAAFVFKPDQFPLSRILPVFVSVFLSSLVYFNLSYLTGLVSFWIDEFWAIRNLKHVVFQLLGGFVIPTTFFSAEISGFLRHSPFFYLGSWNPAVFSSGIDRLDLFWVLIWIFVSQLLILIVQNSAISKYSFTAS